MARIIGNLSPEDDFTHPLGPEPNFNESMYFNFFDRSRSLGGFVRLGNRANEGQAEMTVCLYLPDGRVLNERALAKLRTLDTGHAYVEALLREHGAPPRRGTNPSEWLPRALRAAGVRRLRHPGNHRYLFPLGDRAARQSVQMALPRLPYPRRADPLAPRAATTPHGEPGGVFGRPGSHVPEWGCG